MDDTNEVQPDVVSTETALPEPVSTEQEKPLSRADLEEFFTQQEERIRRTVQSETDKRVAPLSKELQTYRQRATVAEQQLGQSPIPLDNLDPEVRQQIELAQAKGQLGYYQNLRQQEQTQQRQEEQARQAQEQFTSQLNARLTKLGIDVNDKRLDRADDAPAPFDKIERVVKSIIQIRDEDSLKLVDEKVEAAMAKLRKDTGVDSHDTASSGASDSDDVFFRECAEGKHDSPADKKRLKELLRKKTGG